MNKQNVNELFDSKEDISMLSNCCWRLADVALWPTSIHTMEEQAGAEQLLKRYLLAGNNKYQCYLEICQRVLLTRQRMIEDPGYKISNLPCRFFNSEYKGFTLSEQWYRELLSERKKSAACKIQYRALAEAILEFAEDPSMENFNYWKEWFLHNDGANEWLLYSLVAGNILLFINSIKRA